MCQENHGILNLQNLSDKGGITMLENERMQLFEDQAIRTAWDEQREEWYFSVVDVVDVLTQSREPRRYWSDLKRKLKAEGATQLYENIVQLKLMSSDGTPGGL